MTEDNDVFDVDKVLGSKPIGKAATPPKGLSPTQLRERGFVQCPKCKAAVDYSHMDEHNAKEHNKQKTSALEAKKS